jgi:hypothetical protein
MTTRTDDDADSIHMKLYKPLSVGHEHKMEENPVPQQQADEGLEDEGEEQSEEGIFSPLF